MAVVLEAGIDLSLPLCEMLLLDELSGAVETTLSGVRER